jgi:hypothetical protein
LHVAGDIDMMMAVMVLKGKDSRDEWKLENIFIYILSDGGDGKFPRLCKALQGNGYL